MSTRASARSCGVPWRLEGLPVTGSRRSTERGVSLRRGAGRAGRDGLRPARHRRASRRRCATTPTSRVSAARPSASPRRGSSSSAPTRASTRPAAPRFPYILTAPAQLIATSNANDPVHALPDDHGPCRRHHRRRRGRPRQETSSSASTGATGPRRPTTRASSSAR
ncbi:MAG: hypothetical protein MZW92_22660 [Comamonadaceae bacterium]|nr:hypothetical protein [Comamonadaceae bacterium]